MAAVAQSTASRTIAGNAGPAGSSGMGPNLKSFQVSWKQRDGMQICEECTDETVCVFPGQG
jgi:hypothetical protein